MQIRVIPGGRLGASDRACWSAMQQSNPDLGSPYFCPEFTEAVAAERDDVFVGVWEADGAPAGYFPFQRSAMGVARPVGWPMNDCQGVIVARDRPFDAAELLRGCGLKIWDFDHLLASQSAFVPFHKVRDESPVIDLREGYEAYVRNRKDAESSVLEQAGRKGRKLAREVGAIRLDTHVMDESVFERLMGWKSEQYRRTGLVDVLGHAWTVNVLRRIWRTQNDGFAGMLTALYAGDELVAAHLGMRSRTVWHWWFPSYDSRWERYSPGQVLLMEMARSAPGLGLGVIDLGKGESTYKSRFANRAVPLAEGSVSVPSLAVTVRRWRQGAVSWLRGLPMPDFVKAPARGLRRAERWLSTR